MPKSKKQVYRLWPAFIEHAHDYGIGVVWPGDEPVEKTTCIDLNLLQSASEQPFQDCFGHELYPSIEAKAAYLFIHIAGGHILSNGNKRTGVLCLDAFLMVNSRYLTISNDAMKKLSEYVASAGEHGTRFHTLLEQVTTIIRLRTVSFAELKTIDEDEYKSSLRGRRNIRRHPLNQPEAPLSQAPRG